MNSNILTAELVYSGNRWHKRRQSIETKLFCMQESRREILFMSEKSWLGLSQKVSEEMRSWSIKKPRNGSTNVD